MSIARFHPIISASNSATQGQNTENKAVFGAHARVREDLLASCLQAG